MNKKDIYEILIEEKGFKFKKYREKWDKAGKGEIELDYPLHLNFELNFGCNLRCPACLHSLSFKDWPYKVDPNKNISFNKFCEIIDEGVKYGLCSIELNGENEPFLYKDIIRCIEYTKEKNILHILLHTNGTLLTNKLLEEIVKSGLTNISFSLDAATKETYDKIRVGGDYDRVVKNIYELLEIKKKYKSVFPLVRLSFYRNKINFAEASQFKKMWEDKVDLVSFSYFYNPFIGTNRYEEIEKKYRVEGYRPDACTEPYQRLFIFNNGNVAPCCSMFGGNLIVGNIYKDSIYDIWNYGKAKSLRKNMREGGYGGEICKKCYIGYMRKKV